MVNTIMDLVLKENMGYKTLLRICTVINGEYETDENDVNIALNPGQNASFGYRSDKIA